MSLCLKKSFKESVPNAEQDLPRGELAIPFSEINTSIETKIQLGYSQPAWSRRHVVSWLVTSHIFCGKSPLKKRPAVSTKRQKMKYPKKLKFPWMGIL